MNLSDFILLQFPAAIGQQFLTDMDVVGDFIKAEVEFLYDFLNIKTLDTHTAIISLFPSGSPVKNTGVLAYWFVKSFCNAFDAEQVLAWTYLTALNPPPYPYIPTTIKNQMDLALITPINNIYGLPPTPQIGQITTAFDAFIVWCYVNLV